MEISSPLLKLKNKLEQGSESPFGKVIKEEESDEEEKHWLINKG